MPHTLNVSRQPSCGKQRIKVPRLATRYPFQESGIILRRQDNGTCFLLGTSMRWAFIMQFADSPQEAAELRSRQRSSSRSLRPVHDARLLEELQIPLEQSSNLRKRRCATVSEASINALCIRISTFHLWTICSAVPLPKAGSLHDVRAVLHCRM